MSERFLMARLFAVAALTIAVVVACDRVPLTSPTGSTISLSIERTILPLNGQATLRAVVTESAGTPVHNGTTVTFQPSIGRTDPVDAQTVNGIATVLYLAGSVSGTGVIHAFSGGARTGAGNSSAGGIEVKIGAAAAGGISVSATPQSVSQSGGTVTISALVMDPSNNPLPGVSVLFTSPNGTLSSTTAISDSNGIARTQLTTQQTTTVTATAGTAKGEIQVVVTTAPGVTIDTTSPATVGVPHPITVTTSGGGGTNSSPRQVQSVTVEFGDGTSEIRTNVTGAAAFTHTYQREGGYTITARIVDVGGNTGLSTRAIVVQRSLPTATLTAPATVSLAPPTNGVAGFTVAATAAPGQPPIQSVVVRLSDGTVIYSGSAGGAFTYQFTTTGPKAVTLTVTDAAGGTATDSKIVNVTT